MFHHVGNKVEPLVFMHKLCKLGIIFCSAGNVCWVAEKSVFSYINALCPYFFFVIFSYSCRMKRRKLKCHGGKCDVITIKCPFRWQFPMFQNNKAIQEKKSTLQTLLFEVSPPSRTSINARIKCCLLYCFRKLSSPLGKSWLFPQLKFWEL